MNDVDWQACADPEPMLQFLCGKASRRKLRLFAVACCRGISQWIIDQRGRQALEVCEQFAEARVGQKKLSAARRAVFSLTKELETSSTNSLEINAQWMRITANSIRDTSSETLHRAAIALLNACDSPRRHTAEEVAFATAGSVRYFKEYVEDQSGYVASQREQCAVLRDIFGNPFRPLPPRPEAIAPLAERIYAGEWDLMPLLGEWLQEHGYWSEGEHCLDPNNHHVKGCWVVDWVTGRE